MVAKLALCALDARTEVNSSRYLSPVPRRKKYYYNANTHRYERWHLPWWVKLLRAFGFISASVTTGGVLALLAFRFLESPKEKRFDQDRRILQENYSGLLTRLALLDEQLEALEQRDNDVYRAVFERDPLPDSIRQGKDYRMLARQKTSWVRSDTLIARLQQRLHRMDDRIRLQNRSYDTLLRLAATKAQMLAHIPAIQPVSNKNLDRIASGFGYRIDPIYKTPKLHTGLDFAAPMGTPIYATADGTVVSVSYDEGGYGNHVILNHSYGYGTLYGHMVKVKARPGQAVQRGEVIGWVGSTGKSTGPHCHYEVIRNGEKTDPVHYFFHDLSATDYETIVRLAAAGGQSFD
ncbi:MAG: M23 family metallopeptidase [Sphingobacteriales bacterium]|nr:MAG: M23 family metallopeptidase [Sphingobacteriales bacterium]